MDKCILYQNGDQQFNGGAQLWEKRSLIPFSLPYRLCEIFLRNTGTVICPKVTTSTTSKCKSANSMCMSWYHNLTKNLYGYDVELTCIFCITANLRQLDIMLSFVGFWCWRIFFICEYADKDHRDVGNKMHSMIAPLLYINQNFCYDHSNWINEEIIDIIIIVS